MGDDSCGCGNCCGIFGPEKIPKLVGQLTDAEAMKEVRCGCPCMDEKGKKELEMDLLYRTYWCTGWCSDYLFHVGNCHPLISCFTCHPAHPYEKWERALVLLVITGMTLIPAAAIASTTGAVTSAVLIFVVCTLPAIIFQFFLEFLCVQDIKTRTEKGESQWKAYLCECLTGAIYAIMCCCMGCAFIWAGICCVIAIWWINSRGGGFDKIIPVLIQSKIQNWVVWFFIDLFLPCCGYICTWRGQARAFAARGPQPGQQEMGMAGTGPPGQLVGAVTE